MKNLEQIRAMHALEFFAKCRADKEKVNLCGKEGGNILSKLPSLIVSNGLLSAASFAVAKKEGFDTCMRAIFSHLTHEQVKALTVGGYRQGENELSAPIRALAEADALALRRATSEAIAYANYLKRFAKGI